MFKLKNLRYLVVPALLGAAIYGCNQSPPPAAPPQTQQLVAGVPSSPPFIVTGTKTAGDVPQYQSNGTVAWTGPEIVVTDGGAATSLDELSDVAPILDGAAGDVIGWNGTVWDDQTIQAAIVAGLGNGTDNYVITSDGAGGVAWEAAAGGSGLTIDGTIGDGQVPVYDDTDDVYVPVSAGTPVYSVKNFIGGRRAAGSMRGTTGTISSSTNSLAVAAGWDGAEGHGVMVLGAGASHGLGTPNAPTVIPMTVDRATGIADTAVTFTASTSTDRITTSEPLTIADGTAVRFSNQGGGLPTRVTTTAFTETSTLYYLRNFPEVQTVTISGSPTGGTMTYYDGDNPANNVTVAYNADASTLQAALRTMTGWGSVTVSSSGSTPNFTFTITLVGLPGDRQNIGVDARLVTGGNPILSALETTRGGYKVYASSANAISDTSAYDIDGAGTGTHYIVVEGATSYEYDLSALSGGGGWTDDGADGTTTIGIATLTPQTPNRVFCDSVTSAQGYAIFGSSTTDANRYTLARINGLPTCLKIVADAGGYTSLEYGDIGKTLVQGSNDGRIVGFDNATRTIWVDPTNWATSTFPGGAAVAWTITSGTGAGTQTTAAANAVYWDDCGATATYGHQVQTYNCAPYRQVGRMSSTEYREGDYILYPLSSSGVWYVCVESQSIQNSTPVRGNKTAAAAPSFDTDLGDTTRDGDITWMRIDIPCPTTLPSAAVNNALRTYVDAVSGTTVTLHDNATTSVTSQSVLHDDSDAVLAWWALHRDSATISTLHFGEGRFPIYSGVIGTDARYTSVGNYETLFPLYPSSGQQRQQTTWDLAGGQLWWLQMDTPGGMQDGTDTVSMFLHAKSEQTIKGPGRFIAAPSEPFVEHDDAWNTTYWSDWQSSADCDIVGPYISGVDIRGFPRLTSWGWDPERQQAPVIVDVNADYGYSGHAAGWYTPGGTIRGGSLVGRGFDCSTGIYQDFNAVPTPLTVDGLFAKGWRTDGLRIRHSDCKVVNSTFIDCSKLFVSEIISGVFIAHNWIELTDIETGDDRGVEIDDNYLKNSKITVSASSDNANIHDNTVYFDPITKYGVLSAPGTTVVLNGADTLFHHNTIDCTGTGEIRRALTVLGSGRVEIDNNVVMGASSYDFYLLLTINAANSNLKVTNNEFRQVRSPYTCVYLQNTGAVQFKNNRWFFPSTATTGLDVDSCGDFLMDGDELTANIDIASGVTGPVRIRNSRFQSSTASVFAKSGTTLIGNNFAVEPTLSGTLLATSRNTLAESLTKAVTLSASQNNYTWPTICDTILVDANAAYSITGIVPRAKGTIVKIVNVDSSDVLTLSHISASSTAANKININVGADLALGSLDGAEIISTENATAGWSQN